MKKIYGDLKFLTKKKLKSEKQMKKVSMKKEMFEYTIYNRGRRRKTHNKSFCNNNVTYFEENILTTNFPQIIIFRPTNFRQTFYR